MYGLFSLCFIFKQQLHFTKASQKELLGLGLIGVFMNLGKANYLAVLSAAYAR